VHPKRVAEPEEWLYVLAHCLLHLGFGHFQQRFQQREWEAACECVVWQFLAMLKLGTPPEPLRNLPELGGPEFGVVLDTSGSMDRLLLGDCLGAIASFSESRDVVAARVVFCDAIAYDAGYMRPDDIAGSVKVRGRGGTVLQPGIDLLERAVDFPESGPILIVTDGFCDHFYVRREHAILLPEGRALLFAPKGKVFRFRRP